MKYEYKQISLRGYDTFTNIYENAVKEFEDNQKNTPTMFPISHYAKQNPELFSYMKNLSGKYGKEREDYLNYYGAQGWKVISHNPENQSYLLMREENAPAGKVDALPEVTEKDLELKEYSLSFTSDNETIQKQLPESMTVKEGYILKPSLLKNYSNNQRFRTVYYDENQEVKSGFSIRKDTVLSVKFEEVALNYQRIF